MRELLCLQNVSVRFSQAQAALRCVNLAIRREEFTVLLGRSGAGKSTLLRCLNYLQQPTSGRVKAAGFGVLQPGAGLRAHRRRTAMVFQSHHLIERHTALQNVLMGRLGYHSSWRTLFPMGEADTRLAWRCLDRVGLAERAMQRADTLSGGERQRVGIARGLCQEPEILLADEPVASLDPATSHQVLGLLHEICRDDRLTAVLSLHQVELALEYADRIIGLADGQIVFDGTPDSLTDNHLENIYQGSAKHGSRGETIPIRVLQPQ